MFDDTNEFDPLFHASCRTVSSVYSQIADLKKAADAMAAYALSLEREYLTPMEDEAARRILITYWQLRNALLQMVNELRMRGARDRRKYDKTQQSWTQPRHIWELFDAAKYYQKHRKQ
jgi:hypothetical protein